jgi:hypothetical protein
MILHALRQQAFAASLSPARKSGAAALCFHARTKTMLAFTCSFRCLIGAFHGAGGTDGNSKSDAQIVNVRVLLPEKMLCSNSNLALSCRAKSRHL